MSSWIPNLLNTFNCSQNSFLEQVPVQPLPVEIFAFFYDITAYEVPYLQFHQFSIQDQAVSDPSTPVEALDPRGQHPDDPNEETEKEGLNNRDRNMVSNSLKVFRKFASDSAKMKSHIIDAIIRENGLKYSCDQFLRDLESKIPKHRNYLGVKYLKCLLGIKQKKNNFLVVVRVLLSHYCRKEAYPTVLTSWKILRSAKNKQISGTRRIRNILK